MQAEPHHQNTSQSAGSLALARWKGWGWSVAVLIIIAAGGANPYYPASRMLCEVIAAGMIGAGLASSASVRPRLYLPDWLAAGAVALVLLQLLPLPPAVWTELPGRKFAEDIAIAVFGNAGWRPISLDPTLTVRSALTLLPPLAIYLAARSGAESRRAALLRGAALGLAFVVCHALLQRATGMADWTYPYLLADVDFVIANFTNHNHLASFVTCAGLLILAAYPALPDGRPGLGSGSAFAPPVLAGTGLILLLVVVLSGSRAGIVIFLLCSASSALFMANRKRSLKLAALGTGLAVTVASIAAALILHGSIYIPALDRFAPLTEDMRLDFWPNAARVLVECFPAGSGFGTFSKVYAVHEPLKNVGPSFINHAHNDYMELAIEGGLPAILIMAAFLQWYASSMWRAVSVAGTDINARRMVLALLAMLPALIHSLVDYPLRTAAVATICALACAVAVDAADKRVAGSRQFA